MQLHGPPAGNRTRVPWSCVFATGPGLGLIMYILTTLEFPKHNLDFYLLTTSVNAKILLLIHLYFTGGLTIRLIRLVMLRYLNEYLFCIYSIHKNTFRKTFRIGIPAE